jgi:hypothetical protein
MTATAPVTRIQRIQPLMFLTPLGLLHYGYTHPKGSEASCKLLLVKRQLAYVVCAVDPNGAYRRSLVTSRRMALAWMAGMAAVRLLGGKWHARLAGSCLRFSPSDGLEVSSA